MWLDRTIAAAVDISERVNEEAWFQLAHDLRALAGDRVPHLHALAEKLLGSDALREVAKQTVEWPESSAFDLLAQVESLLKATEHRDLNGVLSATWGLMGRAHQAASQ